MGTPLKSGQAHEIIAKLQLTIIWYYQVFDAACTITTVFFVLPLMLLNSVRYFGCFKTFMFVRGWTFVKQRCMWWKYMNLSDFVQYKKCQVKLKAHKQLSKPPAFITSHYRNLHLQAVSFVCELFDSFTWHFCCTAKSTHWMYFHHIHFAQNV